MFVKAITQYQSNITRSFIYLLFVSMLARITSRLQQTSCALHLSISLFLLLLCMVSVPKIERWIEPKMYTLHNNIWHWMLKETNLGCIIISPKTLVIELYLLVCSFIISNPQRRFGTLKPSPSNRALEDNHIMFSKHICNLCPMKQSVIASFNCIFRS